jgi:hypothetical protein
VTPLERLLAEELPTGEVPDYRPGTRYARAARTPWTPEEQARHREDLLAALDGTLDHRVKRRHLHALPPAA